MDAEFEIHIRHAGRSDLLSSMQGNRDAERSVEVYVGDDVLI